MPLRTDVDRLIYFFVTRDNLVPICTYKSEDPHGGADRIVPVTYDALPSFLDEVSEPSRETFVFADLELLDQSELQAAASLYGRLASLGATVFNDPRRTMMRADLLRVPEGAFRRFWGNGNCSFPREILRF